MVDIITVTLHTSKQSINQSTEFSKFRTVNSIHSLELTIRIVGEPDVTHPIRTSWREAQVNVVGDQTHLVSIALQKEANTQFNTALIRTKQGSMLLPNINAYICLYKGGKQTYIISSALRAC